MTDDLNDTLDHKGEEARTCVVHVNLLEINMIEFPDVLFLLCTPKRINATGTGASGCIFQQNPVLFRGCSPLFFMPS